MENNMEDIVLSSEQSEKLARELYDKMLHAIETDPHPGEGVVKIVEMNGMRLSYTYGPKSEKEDNN
jgi:hypothetical protein